MTAYLVRARTPATPPDIGAMTIYLIEATDRSAALDAVKKEVPKNWTVEDVIGVADPKLVALHRPHLGKPEQL
jgi:hypothetical protein